MEGKKWTADFFAGWSGVFRANSVAAPKLTDEDLTSQQDENVASADAEGHSILPKKRIVVIERIIQDSDIPNHQTGLDLGSAVKDLYLPEDATGGTAVKNSNGRAIYAIRTESERKKADHIFLHYTASTNDGPGDLNSHLTDSRTASAHFYIFRNGRIVQAFDFDKTTYTQGGKGLRSKTNRFHVSGRYRTEAPNTYSYSLECASSTKNKGELSSQQKEAIPYALRYIKKRAARRFGASITLNRIWRGYPTYDETNVIDNGQSRVFSDVFGSLIGHIEAVSTSCPGSKFPWKEILTKLGVFPVTKKEKDDSLKKVEKFYKKYDVMSDVQKEGIANYSKYYNDVMTSDMPAYVKQIEVPKQEVPYYYNLSHRDDTVEYVVWYRTKDEVSERDKFIQSIVDNTGKAKYPSDSYGVIA